MTKKTTKTWDRDWTNPLSVTFKMGPVGFVLPVEPVSSSLMLPIGTRSDTEVSPLCGSGNRLRCFRKLSSSHLSAGSKAKSSFPPFFITKMSSSFDKTVAALATTLNHYECAVASSSLSSSAVVFRGRLQQVLPTTC